VKITSEPNRSQCRYHGASRLGQNSIIAIRREVLPTKYMGGCGLTPATVNGDIIVHFEKLAIISAGKKPSLLFRRLILILL
jgi:hypothetical protein